VRRAVIGACFVVLAVAHTSADPKRDVPAELLERIARYVEDYYRRSRTIIGRETVRLQPLDAGLRPDGVQRWLEFELRIDWDGTVKFRDPDETVMLPKSIRTLAIVYNGGIPRLLTLQSYDKYRRFVTGGRVLK
jgi:hypothetical protein